MNLPIVNYLNHISSLSANERFLKLVFEKCIQSALITGEKYLIIDYFDSNWIPRNIKMLQAIEDLANIGFQIIMSFYENPNKLVFYDKNLLRSETEAKSVTFTIGWATSNIHPPKYSELCY